MKKLPKFLILLVLFTGFALSGCMSITETFFFKKDGSGTVEYVIDLSEMASMMEMMSGMGGDEGSESDTLMDSWNEMFTDQTAVNRLSALPGITNVKLMNDKDKNLVGYGYDFESVEALNNALKAVASDSSGSIVEGMDMLSNGFSSFSFDGKKMIRNMPDMNLDKETEEDESAKEMAMAMLKEAFYQSTFKFEQKVKKVKGNNTELTQMENEVLQKSSLIELSSGNETMDIEITVK